MTRPPYAAEYKERQVRRMIDEKVPVQDLAEQTGVGKTTLWRWKKAALDGHRPRAEAAPEARSAAEKMRLVLASKDLEGQELGAFLRAEGIHLADLRRWQDQMRQGLEGRADKLRQSSDQLRQARQANRELTRELRRKEAALAEAAALLVLSKKARRLWGDEDVATTETNDSTSSR